MTQLRTEHLTLRAGDKLLVEDLTLAPADGENWAILGANGSGKSTLLYTLAGLRTPAAGRVYLNGQPIAAVAGRERARALGLLLQEAMDAFPATVREVVLTGRHPHLGHFASEGPADEAIAAAALAAVGLAALAHRPMTTLSGGERRRAEIAALLAQDPPLGLWDEPVNHLDPRHQTALLRLLSDRSRRPGHANLFVLHDVNLALRYCDHALLLLPGGATRSGPINEVVTAAALEAAYGCRMREIDGDRERLFVPAD